MPCFERLPAFACFSLVLRVAPFSGRVMFYFSERALNEIGGIAYTRTVTNKWSLTRWLSLGRETTITSEASPVERVDLALKKIRRRRHVLGDLWDATTPGSVVDATVRNLEVGVMPFLRFGDYGEWEYSRGKARIFWAHASLPPRPTANFGDTRELVVIGSLDNVVNGTWSRGRENTITIDYNYPSDPSILAELVRAELDVHGPKVEEHMSDIATYEVRKPGDAARFAWDLTKTGNATLVHDDGYARTWRRRMPFARARIVATVSDVCEDPIGWEGISVVLARAILIEDLT